MSIGVPITQTVLGPSRQIAETKHVTREVHVFMFPRFANFTTIYYTTIPQSPKANQISAVRHPLIYGHRVVLPVLTDA